MCTNCTPRWFCFSGCVPDKLQEQVVSPTLEEEIKDGKGEGIIIN